MAKRLQWAAQAVATSIKGCVTPLLEDTRSAAAARRGAKGAGIGRPPGRKEALCCSAHAVIRGPGFMDEAGRVLFSENAQAGCFLVEAVCIHTHATSAQSLLESRDPGECPARRDVSLKRQVCPRGALPLGCRYVLLPLPRLPGVEPCAGVCADLGAKVCDALVADPDATSVGIYSTLRHHQARAAAIGPAVSLHAIEQAVSRARQGAGDARGSGSTPDILQLLHALEAWPVMEGMLIAAKLVGHRFTAHTASGAAAVLSPNDLMLLFANKRLFHRCVDAHTMAVDHGFRWALTDTDLAIQSWNVVGPSGEAHLIALAIVSNKSSAMTTVAAQALRTSVDAELGAVGASWIGPRYILHDLVDSDRDAIAAVWPSVRISHYCHWHSIVDSVGRINHLVTTVVSPQLREMTLAGELTAAAALRTERLDALTLLAAVHSLADEDLVLSLAVLFACLYCPPMHTRVRSRKAVSVRQWLTGTLQNDLRQLCWCYRRGIPGAHACNAISELTMRLMRKIMGGKGRKTHGVAGMCVLVCRTLAESDTRRESEAIARGVCSGPRLRGEFLRHGHALRCVPWSVERGYHHS